MGSRTVNVQGMDSRFVPTPSATMQSVTVDGTATALSALSALTTAVFWSNYGSDIRVRFDGTAPEAGVGHFIANGATGTWSKVMATAAKLIAASGSSVLTVSEVTE